MPPETTPWRDPQMLEILTYLKEKKVIDDPFEITSLAPKDPRSSIRDWSRKSAQVDISDPNFNILCGTSPADYERSPELEFVTLEFVGEPEKGQMTIPVVLDEPNAIRISQDISDSFLMADIIDAFPVFDSALRTVIEYKYRMAQGALKTVLEHSPNSRFSLDEKSKLSDIIFTLSNELFSSELVRELSIKELVRYRDAMEEERRKFLSVNMIELLALIDSAPWTDELQKEVAKYVREKLTKSLYEFNDRSKEIWEKLFGKLVVNLSKVTTWAVTGGVAGATIGSIAGNIIPNTGLSEMLVLSLIGAARNMPDLVKELLDSVHELRSHKRNSIAYLADLAKTN